MLMPTPPIEYLMYMNPNYNLGKQMIFMVYDFYGLNLPWYPLLFYVIWTNSSMKIITTISPTFSRNTVLASLASLLDCPGKCVETVRF